MPKYLLFRAGNRQQVAECRYFLLKYLALYNLKPPANTAAVIYTNEPVAFEAFANFFAQFEMPDLQGNTFTKTALLQQFLQQHSDAVLYCDTATYPLQPLEPLFSDIEKGALYLHSPQRYTEKELEKAVRPVMNARDKTERPITSPATARINVWHAAVVGLSNQYKELLTKVAPEENPAATSLAEDYSYTKIFS